MVEEEDIFITKGFRYDLDKYSCDESDYEEEELVDVTKDFLRCIMKNRNNPQFGFVARIDGMKGAGKTTLGLILGVELVYSNLKKRKLGLITQSESFVPSLISVAPKELKDKIVRVKSLDDIENWMVVLVDEGKNTFDAKEALTVENRNVEKGVTIIRQKAIIFLLCSVRAKGVLSALREDADILIIKRNNKRYIKNSEDDIVKEYADTIRSLDRHQAIVDSNYWYFEKEGGLEFDANAKTRWRWIIENDDTLSRNMANESLNIEGVRTKRRQDIVREIAELIITRYGKRILKSKGNNLIKGWIRREHPEYQQYAGNKYVGEIIDDAIYLLEERNKDTNDSISTEIITPTINGGDIPTFADYLFKFYSKNLDEKDLEKKEYLINVLYYWTQGFSIDAIRNEFGGSPNTINKLINKYRSGTRLQNDDFRLGIVLEYYVQDVLGCPRDGGWSTPDNWVYDENKNIIGCIEDKFIYTKSNAITFHKFSNNNDNLTLNPSYLYCKEHGIPQFPLVYFHPKWGSYPLLIPVSVAKPDQPEEINVLVEKSQTEQYIKNFLNFDKEKFFGGVDHSQKET